MCIYSLYLDIFWTISFPTRWADFRTVKQPNTFYKLMVEPGEDREAWSGIDGYQNTMKTAPPDGQICSDTL